MHPARIPVEIKVVDSRLTDLLRSDLNPRGLPLPATPGAAAVDVVACGLYPTKPDGKPDLKNRQPFDAPLSLAPGAVAFVGLGFAMDIGQPGYAAFILPRSGLGSALGVVMANLTGLIDSDYHGEVVAALWNRNTPVVESAEGCGKVVWNARSTVTVGPGERIAQMYFGPVVHADWNLVEEFSRLTERGAGGFGSTGAR